MTIVSVPGLQQGLGPERSDDTDAPLYSDQGRHCVGEFEKAVMYTEHSIVLPLFPVAARLLVNELHHSVHLTRHQKHQETRVGPS